MKEFVRGYISEIHADIAENIYDLGDGEKLITFDYDRIREFCCPLSELGWKALKRFSLGNTDGTFYAHEDGRTLYVYTNSGMPFGRAVLGAKLPAPDDFGGEAVYDDTVFYQVPTRAEDEPYEGGMTYLIRLRDGRFIIIDGGFECSPSELIDTMHRLHMRAGSDTVFEVAAWIFTHPHNDHVTLFFRMFEEKESLAKINIKRLIYNSSCDELLFERCASSAPDSVRQHEITGLLAKDGTEFWKPHTGMSFTIGELLFDVYYTQNEWTHSDMIYLNDASTVFSIKRSGGRKIMMLGDIMEFAGDYIMKMYAPGDLTADAVQVAHHAVRGPDIEIYKAIAPKVCFWSMQPVCYDLYSTKFERNVHLRELDAFHCISCFGPSQITL